MKIEQLVEQDISTVAKEKLPEMYPLIRCRDVGGWFIIDLPADLTFEQLRQLCELSFDNETYQYIFKGFHLPLISILPKENAISYLNRTKRPISDSLFMWKQFVSEINNHFADNDFAQ